MPLANSGRYLSRPVQAASTYLLRAAEQMSLADQSNADRTDIYLPGILGYIHVVMVYIWLCVGRSRRGRGDKYRGLDSRDKSH